MILRLVLDGDVDTTGRVGQWSTRMLACGATACAAVRGKPYAFAELAIFLGLFRCRRNVQPGRVKLFLQVTLSYIPRPPRRWLSSHAASAPGLRYSTL